MNTDPDVPAFVRLQRVPSILAEANAGIEHPDGKPVATVTPAGLAVESTVHPFAVMVTTPPDAEMTDDQVMLMSALHHLAGKFGWSAVTDQSGDNFSTRFTPGRGK